MSGIAITSKFKMCQLGFSICHQSSAVSQKAWTLPWILQLKVEKTLGKLADAVNTNIRFEFEWKERCGCCFQISLIYIVTEKSYSFDIFGRWLKWAVSCLLLCPETDWYIWVEKQGYVFITTDFKKGCFDLSFLTSICVNNYFETDKSWIFY